MKKKTFAVYVMGKNSSPTSFPEETKYFDNEKDLQNFERTCKMQGHIFESFELYDNKNIKFD